MSRFVFNSVQVFIEPNQARCSSSLSVPMPSPSNSSVSKSPTDHLFANAPCPSMFYENNYNLDDQGMHEHMMASLRTIFASQRETELQSNILASFVKTSQKKQNGDCTDPENLSANEWFAHCLTIS